MVVFATQSITDISQSSIASTLREACFTKIYLPNSNALSAEASSIYERFGLNKRQIELVALAQPKRDYYYTSPLGNRLFELGLAPLALAYCTHTSKEQQALTMQLKGEAISTSDFNHQFLIHLGLTDYAIHFNDSDPVKEVA
jgi:type IV secretion system protein VirB4